MRRYLLLVALALLVVSVTGCVIIDAGDFRSRTPTTIRTEECIIRQGLGAVTSVIGPDGPVSAAVTAR